MKKFPWGLLTPIVVLLGIIKLFFFEGTTTFEMLVILLLTHISVLIHKKRTVNISIKNGKESLNEDI